MSIPLQRTLLLATGLFVLLLKEPAQALVSFGRPVALSSYAGLDDPDYLADTEAHSSLAGDGAGNWVAVWGGTAGPPLSDPENCEIWVSRSSDHGANWAPPVALAVTSGPDGIPVVVTDRSGTWLAVWDSNDGVTVSRSVSNGVTWSLPTTPLGDATGLPRLATDEAGTWVLVADVGSGVVVSTRSIDGGVTWEAPVAVDAGGALHASIATDGDGTWIAIWQRYNVGGEVALARSSDNGASWGTPVVLGQLPHGTSLSLTATIATDREGRWVAVWEKSEFVDYSLQYSTSSDDGVTWSPEAPFPAFANGYERTGSHVSSATAADGTIYVVWNSARGGDVMGDLVMARSLDGGLTWNNPSAVNLRGLRDGDAVDAVQDPLGYDGTSRWMANWTSTDTLDGTVGEDNDILFARARDDCPASPLAGCRTPTRPGASRIVLRDDPDGAGDRLSWIWSAGQQVLPGDLGDPTTTSNYVFCLYDKPGATMRPVMETDAGAGLSCGVSACWTDTGDGYRYRDGGRLNGAMGGLDVVPGEDGKSRVKLKAKGDGLGPPRMPLAKAPSVRVQLINGETGACWEATYSTAASNTATLFKATSD